MPARVLRPPQYEAVSGPLVFLAGPVQGARDWQQEAIKEIARLAPTVAVASPRRLTYTTLDEQGYSEQVDWETHHLALAAKEGALLFWLARELDHDPARAYAQTTRFELAEWVTRHRLGEPSKIVIGLEDGFPGARYIRYRVPHECPDIPLVTTLAAACEQVAIHLEAPTSDSGAPARAPR